MNNKRMYKEFLDCAVKNIQLDEMSDELKAWIDSKNGEELGEIYFNYYLAVNYKRRFVRFIENKKEDNIIECMRHAWDCAWRSQSAVYDKYKNGRMLLGEVVYKIDEHIKSELPISTEFIDEIRNMIMGGTGNDI